MSRGDIWTVSGGPGYAGKPRPAIIIQDDRFDTTASVTICAFTTNPIDVPIVRPTVSPTGRNGLELESRMMVDKIMTVPRTRLGARIGALDDEDVVRLNRAIVVFLGLAG